MTEQDEQTTEPPGADSTEGAPASISRRRALGGLAAAAGIGAALAAVYGITEVVKKSEGTDPEPDLAAVFINDKVPAADPDSRLWHRARAQRIALEGQAIITPLKSEATITAVTARALHDGETIAFLLEWRTEDMNEHTIKIDQFRDACGVFLGAYPGDTTLWMMGTPDSPVTILHWKADWQKDIDAGFQDLEVAFPNADFEFYPPLVGVVNPKVPDDYPPDARNRLPGWYSGNPLSQPVKATPVEKLKGIGPGTLEQFSTQNASGRGGWSRRRWRATLARPLAATDEDEIDLEPGGTYSLAFTVWTGTDDDRGARKQLTKLGKLEVEKGS
jgi:hypothetical protein